MLAPKFESLSLKDDPFMKIPSPKIEAVVVVLGGASVGGELVGKSNVVVVSAIVVVVTGVVVVSNSTVVDIVSAAIVVLVAAFGGDFVTIDYSKNCIIHIVAKKLLYLVLAQLLKLR